MTREQRAALIRARMAEMIEEADLSQREIASRLGFTEGAITGWKNGNEPELAVLAELLELCDQEPNWLFGISVKDREYSEAADAAEVTAAWVREDPEFGRELSAFEKHHRRIIERIVFNAERRRRTSKKLAADKKPRVP